MHWLGHVGVAAAVFALILPAELPDKTMVATLVLATRYRPWPVWFGAALAFAVQSGIAVAFGGVVGLLPGRPRDGVVAAMFALGAVLLLRPVGTADDETIKVQRATRLTSAARRQALTSFAVLFAAEWGDVSQLVTVSLQARYHDPFSVFAGAWLAMAGVAAVAVVAGRGVVRRFPLGLLQRVAGVAFAALALIFLASAVQG